MEHNRWQDWAMLLFGAWLFVSPVWMDLYASGSSLAAWNAYIVGLPVMLLGWASLNRRERWHEWLNFAIGVWLVLAPFLLGFFGDEPGAAWTQIIMGVLIGGDALALLAVAGPGRERMRV